MSYLSSVLSNDVNLLIYLSEDGGESLSIYPVWELGMHLSFDDMERTTAIINLSPYVGQSNLKLVFIYDGYGAPVYIDDIDLHHSTGISDESLETVNIYPNPASNAIHVTTDEEMTAVEIFNMMGQRVSNSSEYGTNALINTSMLTPGNYILRIHTNNGILHRKVTISR